MEKQRFYTGDAVTLDITFIISAGIITCTVWHGERVTIINDTHPDNQGRTDHENRIYQVERASDRLTFWLRGSHLQD
jgi:hypothetical protein